MPMDMFLTLDGIPGESTDGKHAKWIEVLSFSHGMAQIIGGSRSSQGGATGDKTVFYAIAFEDVLISSYSATGARNGDGVPSESVTLNPGKYEWTYTQTDQKTGKAGGKIASNWSLITNKGA